MQDLFSLRTITGINISEFVALCSLFATICTLCRANYFFQNFNVSGSSMACSSSFFNILSSLLTSKCYVWRTRNSPVHHHHRRFYVSSFAFYILIQPININCFCHFSLIFSMRQNMCFCVHIRCIAFTALFAFLIHQV